MPLFSLSAAHANDRAGKGEFVLVNAALMLFYSFGAIGGPFAASTACRISVRSRLFVFSAGVYAIFIVIMLYRMGVSGVPEGQRGRFSDRLAIEAASRTFAHIDGFRPAGQADERFRRTDGGTINRYSGLTKAAAG